MAILINSNTRLIVQGITGQAGRTYTRQMINYGTNVVGGVTPQKGGEWVHGKPVFDSVRKAKDATDANASLIFVPAAFCADAIYEAVDAGIELIVCITRGMPIRDMLMVREYMRRASRSILIGPNCPGVITPRQSNVGIIPDVIGLKGNTGIVSVSGTLMYELVMGLTRMGIGQSTCVSSGEDMLVGTSISGLLALFEDDAETEKIVLIGESQGTAEFEAAAYIKSRMTKPVVGYIAGYPTSKVQALQDAGVRVARTPDEIPLLLQLTYDS